MELPSVDGYSPYFYPPTLTDLIRTALDKTLAQNPLLNNPLIPTTAYEGETVTDPIQYSESDLRQILAAVEHQRQQNEAWDDEEYGDQPSVVRAETRLFRVEGRRGLTPASGYEQVELNLGIVRSVNGEVFFTPAEEDSE
jgi:hypothetical protein